MKELNTFDPDEWICPFCGEREHDSMLIGFDDAIEVDITCQSVYLLFTDGDDSGMAFTHDEFEKIIEHYQSAEKGTSIDERDRYCPSCHETIENDDIHPFRCKECGIPTPPADENDRNSHAARITNYYLEINLISFISNGFQCKYGHLPKSSKFHRLKDDIKDIKKVLSSHGVYT